MGANDINFQTATHFHAILKEGVWAPSIVGGEHIDAHSPHYHHQRSPRFGRVGWSPRWSMYALMLWLRLYNLSKCIAHRCYTNRRCLRTFHTNIALDLGELTKVLGEVCVQIMPLCYRCGCITFQTASHIHVIHIEGVWAPSIVVDGHMDAHLYHYRHKHSPRFGRVEQSPGWSMCANYATMLWLRL